MPTYKYTVVNPEGKEEKGEIFASTRDEVAENLRSRNFLITEIELKEKFFDLERFRFFRRIPLFERMMFVRQLATMVSSGLPLASSLAILAAQTSHSRLKKILFDLEHTVKSGQTLSFGLSRYPEAFSEIFISMVKVGELSGNLDKVLSHLALELQKEYELKLKIRGALAYPTILISAMLVIGTLLLIFVVPPVIQIFRDLEIELPLITRILLSISEFFSKYFLVLFLAFLILLILFIQFINTRKGKELYYKTISRIPWIKKIVFKTNLARFSRTLSNLLKSGVPIVESLEVVSNALPNPLYKKSIKNAALTVKRGASLATALEENPMLFPPIVTRMIRVGEKTGEVEGMLERLSLFYEAEIDNFVRNISTIIEPILLLLVGLAIAFLALSIIGPIYSVIQRF